MNNALPTYDAIVNNQVNFDPITLMPVFDPLRPDLRTPSGAPINFYVPPPPPAPVVSAPGSITLPLLIGVITIAALIVIYYFIRKRT